MFDYTASCYGRLIQVEFLQKIRDEEKFPNMASMVKAIQKDTEYARDYFQKTIKSAYTAQNTPDTPL